MCFCTMLWLCLFSLLTLGIHSVCGFLSLCDDEIECGRPDIQPASARIVGGREARPGSLPWMAMVVWCDYMKCGGAILNDRFIITAAHCFEGPLLSCPSLLQLGSGDAAAPQARSWSVYVGKHNVMRSNAGEMKMEVEKVIIHPSYNNHTQQNDVAVVKLKEKIEYSSLIKPLCLPTDSTPVPSLGQGCIVAGYGQTFGYDTYSLQQLTVPILSDEQCSLPDWYGNSFYPPDQFCAGFERGGKDACLGDSGSPLICSFDGVWYASGIVSKGRGCAEPKKPGVYANMSVHRTWIMSTMEENGFASLCP